ncbi:MAG TPA: uracil-DNA glycosylase family protein [Caulobacteraceae bacterium]|jgi:uracil-DNA glycosylase
MARARDDRIDGPAEAGGLDALLAEIRACRACAEELPHEPRPVVFVRPQARILLCGQAPGRRVHESGLPFDDPSGDRLRDWLGVDRETFYGHPAIGVAAMAFCYPGTVKGGGDLPPPARCAQLWRARLLANLPQVELTLLMGLPAQKWTLGADHPGSMDAAVRDWRRFLPGAICLPHPSWRNSGWLRRNPWFEAEVTPYLRQRVAEILSP